MELRPGNWTKELQDAARGVMRQGGPMCVLSVFIVIAMRTDLQHGVHAQHSRHGEILEDWA